MSTPSSTHHTSQPNLSFTGQLSRNRSTRTLSHHRFEANQSKYCRAAKHLHRIPVVTFHSNRLSFVPKSQRTGPGIAPRRRLRVLAKSPSNTSLTRTPPSCHHFLHWRLHTKKTIKGGADGRSAEPAIVGCALKSASRKGRGTGLDQAALRADEKHSNKNTNFLLSSCSQCFLLFALGRLLFAFCSAAFLFAPCSGTVVKMTAALFSAGMCFLMSPSTRTRRLASAPGRNIFFGQCRRIQVGHFTHHASPRCNGVRAERRSCACLSCGNTHGAGFF